MTKTPQELRADEAVGIQWRTSTASSDGGGRCVEVGPLDDGSGRVAVRHSQHPGDATILYSRSEWEAFIAGAKGGEFDFS